jgi:hypothetical protein
MDSKAWQIPGLTKFCVPNETFDAVSLVESRGRLKDLFMDPCRGLLKRPASFYARHIKVICLVG